MIGFQWVQSEPLTHGLHVDGDEPEDNVFTKVGAVQIHPRVFAANPTLAFSS